MFINSVYYSELARDYKKNKETYPYQDEYISIFKELNRDKKKNEKLIYPVFDDLSHSAQEFAIFWIDRFINGFSVGGKPITGEHAFYLNACGIDVTKEYDIEAHRQSKKRIGYRDFDFPDFWDEDYKYFWTCDIARFGISEERYDFFKREIMDFNIIETPENMGGGLNHLWLKPRGVGASWKGAEKAAHNQFLKPKSNTFVFAESKEYLGSKDGFFAKYIKMRSFIQEKVWFLRKEFFKESNTEFIYKTGWEEEIAGSTIVTGFQSTVSGVVVDGDSDKGRGKRGDAIFEEFGSFPTVDKVWNKYEQSAVEYGIVHGQARGFGTGGDSKGDKGGTIAGYTALKKMTYDPSSYRIFMFKDLWNEFGVKTGLCQFTPAYINITDKDENGNSLPEIAKEKQAAERETWKEAADSNLYIEKCAEMPWEPKEAFNAIGDNLFNVKLFERQRTRLQQTGLHNKLVSYGDIEYTKKGVEFISNSKKRPYEDYPYTDNNKDSCVCVYQRPFKDKKGLVPQGLYRICVDPYRNGGKDGPSIGSIYVIENPNKYTIHKGDIITAWYNGRPSSDSSEQEQFCKILFGLAEIYNAKIGLESGAESAIVSYAKNRKNLDSRGRRLTRYLEEQFQLAFNESIATKKTTKKEFGMHMTPERRIQGLNYLNDMFNRPKGIYEGETLRFIDFIFDMGLLNEVIDYKGLNADRISSLIIGAYYEKELLYKPQQDRQTSRFSDVDKLDMY